MGIKSVEEFFFWSSPIAWFRHAVRLTFLAVPGGQTLPNHARFVMRRCKRAERLNVRVGRRRISEVRKWPGLRVCSGATLIERNRLDQSEAVTEWGVRDDGDGMQAQQLALR